MARLRYWVERVKWPMPITNWSGNAPHLVASQQWRRVEPGLCWNGRHPCATTNFTGREATLWAAEYFNKINCSTVLLCSHFCAPRLRQPPMTNVLKYGHITPTTHTINPGVECHNGLTHTNRPIFQLDSSDAEVKNNTILQLYNWRFTFPDSQLI